MPTPHGMRTSLSVPVVGPPAASHCTPSGNRNWPRAPLCTSNTLETRHRRREPLGGPSTRNSEPASQSSNTVRSSTIFCDRDLRSRSVAMSRTTVRKKSRSPCACRRSRLVSTLCADTGHLGSRTLESMSSDSMLIGLGGNDVNLNGGGKEKNIFCLKIYIVEIHRDQSHSIVILSNRPNHDFGLPRVYAAGMDPIRS